MTRTPSIDADMTVNEVLLARPEAAGPLHHSGVDACCGGGRTLREVAELHGLDVHALLRAVDGPTPAPGGAAER